MKDAVPPPQPSEHSDARSSSANVSTPLPADREEPGGPHLSDDDILGALGGTIKPVRRSALYHASQLVVAIGMVILPLAYLALVIALGYLILWYVVEGFAPIAAEESMRLFIIAYICPLFVGVVMLFFLIKPLFAPPPKGPEPYQVDAESQPLLFAYVDRLSALLGAPRPKQIHLDCNVNASASFRRGFLSMAGSDLVLTIGLPLVKGMTLRQLTGVLAHELGHFSQGAGLRLSYLIRRISHWFARVVYERDSFDLKLEDASRRGGFYWRLVMWTARACVWIGRRILWVLMWIGTLISAVLLRQMEYDADRYEIRIAGSQEFTHTTRRLAMLLVGQQVAVQDLERNWQEERLPDRLPGLVSANASLLDDDTKSNIWSDRLGLKTGWFDTHPSDADRIQSALNENAMGLVQIDAPATVLFKDYEAISTAVSKAYYESVLGAPVTETNVIPTEQLLDERTRRAQRFAALRRFFQGHVNLDMPVFLGADRITPAADAAALRTSVEETRKRTLESFPEDAETRRELLRNRLYLALQLLHVPETREPRADDDEKESVDMENVERKVTFLAQLEPHFPHVHLLRHSFEGLMSELQSFDAMRRDSDYQGRLGRLAGETFDALNDLNAALAACPYPYEHAKADCTCADYAVPELPPARDLDAILGCSQRALQYLYDLYFRVVAELATAAEWAEQRVGLPELPAPVEPEEDPGSQGGGA